MSLRICGDNFLNFLNLLATVMIKIKIKKKILFNKYNKVPTVM